MGQDGSLPCLKEEANCFYSEPDEVSPRLHILLTYYLFNTTYRLVLFCVPHKYVYAFLFPPISFTYLPMTFSFI